MQGTYSLELFGIFFNRLRVQHLPVMLAGFQILVIVLGESNLLFIVTELEIRDVVFGLLGRIVRSSVLLPLFLLLALLLQLLWRLLGFRAKYRVLIFLLRMAAWVQSPLSMHSPTWSSMNSVFSRRFMDPNVSTCSSQRISAAALISPCSFLMFDRIRVTLARSTSTKIYAV